jgi:hypothetical protein
MSWKQCHYKVFSNLGNRKKSAGVKSVFQEVFISICFSKHALTDGDSVLLLHVSQQRRDKFCTDVVHLKFSSSNCMVRSYTDAHHLNNLSDCQTMISTNHLTNSLDVTVVY